MEKQESEFFETETNPMDASRESKIREIKEGKLTEQTKFQIKTIEKIQTTQIKKIHSINLTEEELRKELISQKNPAFIEALKKGSILFGQEKFIKFVKNKLEKKYIG